MQAFFKGKNKKKIHFFIAQCERLRQKSMPYTLFYFKLLNILHSRGRQENQIIINLMVFMGGREKFRDNWVNRGILVKYINKFCGTWTRFVDLLDQNCSVGF